MAIQGYRITVSDTSGEEQIKFYNPLSVVLDKKLNWFDDFTIALPRYPDEPVADYFVTDAIVEIDRLIDGVYYPCVGGFHRTPQRTIQQDDQKVFWSYGRGYLDLILRRTIMYPAEHASPYILKGAPAETVMKQFVIENMTGAAVSPPRLRPGAFAGLTLIVEGDQGRGPRWFGQRSNKNLLEVLSEISTGTGVDFGIRRLYGTTFEFYCGYPQLGQDLSDTITFSPELFNMVAPSYTIKRTEEANVVLALGQGQGAARHYVLRQTGATGDSPWNDREAIVDARGEDTYNGILQSAVDALEDLKAQESFPFEVLQTDDRQFDRDYTVGDIVTAKFEDITRRKKVVGCHIAAGQDRSEEVTPDFADLPVL